MYSSVTNVTSKCKVHNCIQMSARVRLHPDSKKVRASDLSYTFFFFISESGLLDPSAVFAIEQSTGQVTCLASLISEGKLNPETGKLIVSGREMSLADAIENNLLQASVDPNKVECHFCDLL